MQKPTATELIERIEGCYLGDDIPCRIHDLLHDVVCHLSDPWISVEERLPTEDECKTHNEGFNVLFRSKYCSDPIALCAYFHDGKFQFEEDDTGDFYVPDWGIFVAWCPLPPLPQKAGEE